jgi:hypothetical protein
MRSQPMIVFKVVNLAIILSGTFGYCGGAGNQINVVNNSQTSIKARISSVGSEDGVIAPNTSMTFDADGGIYSARIEPTGDWLTFAVAHRAKLTQLMDGVASNEDLISLRTELRLLEEKIASYELRTTAKTCQGFTGTDNLGKVIVSDGEVAPAIIITCVIPEIKDPATSP